MKSRGTHHVVELLNCESKILNSPEKLEKLVIDGINKSGLSYEKIISHKFNPVGITVLAIISESHIALHTYPEAGNVSLDVYTCSDAKKQEKFVRFIEKKLKPNSSRIAEVQRGSTIELINPSWIVSESNYDYEVKYYVDKVLFEKRSKYQLIEIIQNKTFGRMLFLDRDLQIAEHDAHIYNKALVDVLKSKKGELDRVAVLGGGDGGILHEVLKYKPESVTLIDIDEDVVEASKKYLKKICYKAFDDPRVTVVYQDVMKYLAKGRKFDAIISDLTMHPEAFTRLDRPTYLSKLFDRIKSRLKKGGILSMQCSSSFDAETFDLVNKILSERFSEISYNKVYIPSFCEEWIFATAKN